MTGNEQREPASGLREGRAAPDRSNLIRVMPAQGSFAGSPQARKVAVTLTIGRLHLITPNDPGAGTLRALDAALSAGAPVVQVRLKDRTDSERFPFAMEVRSRCRSAGATCIMDDRTDLALAVGADGVHVGADDLPVAVVRDVMGTSAVIGATCRNAEDARRAEAAGASYVGAGPVHRSSTKSGLPPPMGARGIAAIASAVSIPVIAISGITVESVPELVDAGAHGVAVIAAVFGASDPGGATSGFLDALAQATAPSPAHHAGPGALR